MKSVKNERQITKKTKFFLLTNSMPGSRSNFFGMKTGTAPQLFLADKFTDQFIHSNTNAVPELWELSVHEYLSEISS